MRAAALVLLSGCGDAATSGSGVKLHVGNDNCELGEKTRRDFFQPQIDDFAGNPASWVRPLEQAR